MVKEMSFEDSVAVLLGESLADPTNEAVKAQYVQCRDMLLQFKAKQGTTLEQLEKNLTERLESAKKKAEASEKATIAKALRDQKTATIAKVEGAATLEEARALIPEVIGYGERFAITITPEGFSTNLKVAAKGGGQGRPGATDPSGFNVVASGEAILGGFNTWVKEQLKAEAFDKEIVAKLHGSQSGKLKAKAKTSAVLLEAGIVSVSEEAEATEEAEAAEEAEATEEDSETEVSEEVEASDSE